MLSQWSQWSRRTGCRVVNTDLDILFVFYFRYISFVHKILIVITWVVMSGTFINGLHNGWCDHRPYTHVIPYSKVHGANIGLIWGRQDPGGPHVGPMNFAILDVLPERGHGWAYAWAYATVWAVIIAFYDNTKTFWYGRGTPAFHVGVSGLPRKSHESRRAFFLSWTPVRLKYWYACFCLFQEMEVNLRWIVQISHINAAYFC